MIGMPGENFKTIRESGKLMGEIAAKEGVSLDIRYDSIDIPYALPLCGTPMYEYGKQFGLIGQTEAEEEKFLEQTSNVGAHKRYYINLNGAPMSEVVFWDILVYLEAARTYAKLMKGKTEDEEMKKKYISILKLHQNNPHASAKQKKYKILGLIDKKINQINPKIVKIIYLLTIDILQIISSLFVGRSSKQWVIVY